MKLELKLLGSSLSTVGLNYGSFYQRVFDYVTSSEGLATESSSYAVHNKCKLFSYVHRYEVVSYKGDLLWKLTQGIKCKTSVTPNLQVGFLAPQFIQNQIPNNGFLVNQEVKVKKICVLSKRQTVAKLWFSKWFCKSVCSGKVYHLLTYFTDEIT